MHIEWRGIRVEVDFNSGGIEKEGRKRGGREGKRGGKEKEKVWVVVCGCHICLVMIFIFKGRHTRKGGTHKRKHKPLRLLLLFHLFAPSGGTEPRVG